MPPRAPDEWKRAAADQINRFLAGIGDYRENWKEKALVYVRDTREKMNEIFPGPRACDPGKMRLREFICPGCGELLEVEAVPPGFPLIFDFVPDLD